MVGRQQVYNKPRRSGSRSTCRQLSCQSNRKRSVKQSIKQSIKRFPKPYLKPCNKRCKKRKNPSQNLNRAPQISSSIIHYLAYSDGKKCTYSDKDAFLLSGCSSIPGPQNLSFAQLFVNGILQPPSHYELERGQLRLTTMEPPAAGVPILLYGIRLKLNRPIRKRDKYRKCAKVPRGAESALIPVSSGASCHKPYPNKKESESDSRPALIKPFAVATSTMSGTIATKTDTAVVDAVIRLSALVTPEMINSGAGTTTIPAASWVTDTGNPLTGGIPLMPPGGSTSLSVNGISQQGGLFSITPAALTITSADILAGTPVNLEMHDYSGTTSTSSSLPALTITTIVSM